MYGGRVEVEQWSTFLLHLKVSLFPFVGGEYDFSQVPQTTKYHLCCPRPIPKLVIVQRKG
jgi:hypothetical protein